MTDDPVRTHRAIWEQIPWIVNGSASRDQRCRIEAHLQDCLDCRDELALQTRIHAGMNNERAGGDAHRSLAGLFQRIDASTNAEADYPDDRDVDAASPVAAQRARRPSRFAAIAAVLIAQSAGLAVMGYLLLQRPDGVDLPAADYQTLSRAEVASPLATIRFVPAPELTVQALQAMLDEAGVRIVDSRARSAIYGLAPISADQGQSASASAAAISLLRGKPGVLLVEPIAMTDNVPRQ